MKYQDLKKMIQNSPAVFNWLYTKKTEAEKKDAANALGFGDNKCEDVEQTLLLWHIFWAFMLITGVIFLVYFFMSIIRIAKMSSCDVYSNSRKTNAAILIGIALILSWLPGLGPVIGIALLFFAGAQMDMVSKSQKVSEAIAIPMGDQPLDNHSIMWPPQYDKMAIPADQSKVVQGDIVHQYNHLDPMGMSADPDSVVQGQVRKVDTGFN